jgi:tetratricopeptide (TPR) repeat protein
VNNSRIEILQQYLADEPNDPFNLYALAVEYLPSEPLKAKEYFEQLLAKHPDYLGTYYHAGKLFYSLGETAKGKKTLEEGIALAFAQQKTKALNELRSALNEILDEEMD